MINGQGYGFQKYLKKEIKKTNFKDRDISVDRVYRNRGKLSSREQLIGKALAIHADPIGA